MLGGLLTSPRRIHISEVHRTPIAMELSLRRVACTEHGKTKSGGNSVLHQVLSARCRWCRCPSTREPRNHGLHGTTTNGTPQSVYPKSSEMPTKHVHARNPNNGMRCIGTTRLCVRHTKTVTVPTLSRARSSATPRFFNNIIQ